MDNYNAVDLIHELQDALAGFRDAFWTLDNVILRIGEEGSEEERQHDFDDLIQFDALLKDYPFKDYDGDFNELTWDVSSWALDAQERLQVVAIRAAAADKIAAAEKRIAAAQASVAAEQEYISSIKAAAAAEEQQTGIVL